MRTPHRPVRWQRGNFFLNALHTHSDSEERTITTAFSLAQIRNIQESGTDAQGAILRQAVRRLEVGGIKVTFERHMVAMGDADNTNPGQQSNLTQVDTKWLVCSDRTVMDETTGIPSPAALATTNFFTNTQPAAVVGEVQDFDEAFPTRIHWQDYRCLVQGYNNRQEGSAEPPDDLYYGAQAVGVYNTHSGTNLRLRLRLDDDEGLYLCFTSHIRNVAQLSVLIPEVSCVATGTIWYRYVF